MGSYAWTRAFHPELSQECTQVCSLVSGHRSSAMCLYLLFRPMSGKTCDSRIGYRRMLHRSVTTDQLCLWKCMSFLPCSCIPALSMVQNNHVRSKTLIVRPYQNGLNANQSGPNANQNYTQNLPIQSGYLPPQYPVPSSSFPSNARGGQPPVDPAPTLRDVPIFSSRTGVIRFWEDDPRVAYSDYIQQRETYGSAQQREGLSTLQTWVSSG
jgi:hypothetical protein